MVESESGRKSNTDYTGLNDNSVQKKGPRNESFLKPTHLKRHKPKTDTGSG